MFIRKTLIGLGASIALVLGTGGAAFAHIDDTPRDPNKCYDTVVDEPGSYEQIVDVAGHYEQIVECPVTTATLS